LRDLPLCSLAVINKKKTYQIRAKVIHIKNI
jgi:hypothetical protein